MRSLLIRSSRAWALAALLAAPALSQGGFATEKHPDLGLTFPRARDYEQIPTQPDETVVVLYFAEKLPKDPKEKPKAIRPELSVLWMDFVPDVPAGKPGGDTGAPPSGGGEEGGEAPTRPHKPPITNLDRYVDQRLPQFALSPPIEGKPREGWNAREYTIAPKRGGPGKVRGWAFAYSKPERTIAFVGICSEDELDKQVKIWRQSAEKVDFDEPEEQSTAKLETLYARSKLLDTPFRINVRKKLVRGWKAEDTDNYIVIYDSPDQPLMRRVIRDIELIRKEYERLFPPEKPVTAVSTVRVCKNLAEYHAYGGPDRTAGYWNSQTEELVLYDAEKVEKDKRKSDADTFIVLYHEAFHQYIYYSAGELPPHSWYDEGHGDFFSGAIVKDAKMRGIGVNSWRIDTIKSAIADGRYVPWGEIIKYEQPQYYDSTKVHICYAQGWSMIYFLRMSKDVAKNPAWSKILPTYFATLKRTWGEQLAKLEAEGRKDDRGARAQAGYVARNSAVDAAFEGVNIAELESAWKIFTLELELPDKK